nr:hypothetical protein [Actinomadura rayongensis]
MGALPDVEIVGSSVADWQALFDLVRSGGWAWEYAEGGAVRALPLAEAVFSRPAGAESAELRVWPHPAVLAVFRLYSDERIDFDVDVRELQGQERLDVLCGFLTVLGRRLGKAVEMSAEGDSGEPVIGFSPDADRVVLLADPRFP